VRDLTRQSSPAMSSLDDDMPWVGRVFRGRGDASVRRERKRSMVNRIIAAFLVFKDIIVVDIKQERKIAHSPAPGGALQCIIKRVIIDI